MNLAVSYGCSFTKAPRTRTRTVSSVVERRGPSRCVRAPLQPPVKSWWTRIASSEQGSQRYEPSTKASCGSNLERLHLQLNGQSAFAGAETSHHCSDKANMTYFAKGILQAMVRALFLIGLGLGVSLPSSARTAPSFVNEVSASDRQNNVDYGLEATKKSGRAMHSQKEDDSLELDESTQQEMPKDADISEIHEDELRLSDAFWRGIPTPEGSLLHTLKIRLSEDPSEIRALEALLRAVLEQKDMLRALTVVETMLEVQPNNVEWKFLKARAHEFLGELLMAKQEYDELLSWHPLSARFLQGLVKILDTMGEQAHALELIRKALDQAILESKNEEARNLGVLLGQFYIQLGNFEDALHHLSSMIEGDPDDFRPYLCQGLAYMLMKQTDLAKQSFKKYAERCPPDAFEQKYMDSLMLRAQTSKRIDALSKRSMKTSSRNMKKSPKPMKQPSIFGNVTSQHGDHAD